MLPVDILIGILIKHKFIFNLFPVGRQIKIQNTFKSFRWLTNVNKKTLHEIFFKVYLEKIFT